ncbi:MAG: leucine-rich repeat protein, partial [Clostridia bacterium]|nr:leucine-rich repeat protein [Clostridia bacterium]
MKRKILAVIMVFAVVLGTFAGTSLTASAETKTYPVGAQVNAYVDTGAKTLTFSTSVSSTADPVKMNQITIGNAPWKEYAEEIEHIVVENKIANITAGAATNLPNLKDVEIGADVSEIDPRAFVDSPSLNSFTVKDGNKFFATSANKQILLSKDGKILVHAAIASLKTYTVPNSIIAIADYAFYGASKLERFKIGTGLAAIGNYAFAGCSIKGDPSDDDEIRIFTIPDNVRIIGANAFQGNLFETTTFSYNLNDIGESAFEDCTALTNIERIDNPVMIVGKNAFLNTGILNSAKETIFNGDRYEWSDIVKNDDTLSKIRYSMLDPQDKEYVAYDVNGGLVTFIPQNQLFTKNEEVTISNVDAADNKIEPAHAKYYFAGWTEDKPDDTVTFTEDYMHAGDTFKPKTAVRLYAAWTKDITLIFDANGGTLTEGLSPVRKDDPVESYKLPKAVPTNTKYKFLGWSKDKDAASPDYSPEGTMRLTENTILYAVWNTDGPFDVTIDANGGKFSDGETKKVLEGVKVKGTDYTVTGVETPTRERYEFAGWSVDGGAATTSPVVKTDYNTTVKATWKFLGP